MSGINTYTRMDVYMGDSVDIAGWRAGHCKCQKCLLQQKVSAGPSEAGASPVQD